MANTLHGKATTTPAIRKIIRESKDTIAVLAERYHINPKTVIKWKHRESVQDKKCGPPSESKSLTKQQEAIAVALRKHSKLSIRDCFSALKKILPHLSRSSLHRSYQRYNISRIGETKKVRKKKNLKVYPPGYVHIDVTAIPTEEKSLYLFVGIDSTTKFCFACLYKDQTPNTAVKFLKAMRASFPTLIYKIETDNGTPFSHDEDKKEAHMFTQTCKALGIAHHKTKPHHPWTYEQVASMNRIITQATVQNFHYKDHGILEQHLQTFVNAYNYTQSLTILQGLCPYEKVYVYLKSAHGKPCANPSYKIAEGYTFSL